MSRSTRVAVGSKADRTGVENARPSLGLSRGPSRGVLFTGLYSWYILAATLDVVLTHTILHHFGGSEVNRLADALIQRHGVAGMIGLKYSSIVLVVIICEYVGRRDTHLGQRLAMVAIAMSALPVGVGLLRVRAWSDSQLPIVVGEYACEQPLRPWPSARVWTRNRLGDESIEQPPVNRDSLPGEQAAKPMCIW